MATNKYISRGDLDRMHAVVRLLCRMQQWGPGSEAFSLMCALAASRGNWPRVMKATAERLTWRWAGLLAAVQ